MTEFNRRSFMGTVLLGATALTPVGRAMALTGSLQDVGSSAMAAPRATVYTTREIVTLDCRPLIQQNGSLHCLTMHLPVPLGLHGRLQAGPGVGPEARSQAAE